MPTPSETLNRLAKRRELQLTVTGRKSGRAISMPIWFVLEDGRLSLLPVTGSDTQWYQNILVTPSIRLHAASSAVDCNISPLTDRTQVSSVIEKFRAKYGDGGMQYYSKLDVAAVAEPR